LERLVDRLRCAWVEYGPSAALTIEHQVTKTTDGFGSLIGKLRAFVSNITMTPVEDGEVLGDQAALYREFPVKVMVIWPCRQSGDA